MSVLELLKNYLVPFRTEYQAAFVTELEEKLGALRNELIFRERLIKLIDSLGNFLQVAHDNDKQEDVQSEDCREGEINDVTNINDKGPNVEISHMNLYRFAMTLLENLTYDNTLSRYQESHKDELLKAYPTLSILVDMCSRNAPVPGYILPGKKSLAGPADRKTARIIVRRCLRAETLQRHRLAEIRAWKEAKHHLRCISTAETYITSAKPNPEDDLQTESIISAMHADIQSFPSHTHFIPAEPQASDIARILEPRVFFDEEHLGGLIQTFSPESKEYLSKMEAITRQNIIEARFPFTFPLATP